MTESNDLPQRPRAVPEPTLRRLPLYYRYLKGLPAPSGSVSCTQIGAELELDPTQVRKDIEATGIVGRPRTGYTVSELISAIERFLGWDSVTEAVMVGVGSLGQALLGYERFSQCGLNIVAAFDADPGKVGHTIRGREVQSIDTLAEVVRTRRIGVAILTVPAGAAQQVADLLVREGVKAIWNFAPLRLRVPPEILVHNEDLYCSLASLSAKLVQRGLERSQKTQA